MYEGFLDTLEEVCQRQVDSFVANGYGKVSAHRIIKLLNRHKIMTCRDLCDAMFCTLEDIKGLGPQNMRVVISMRREVRRGFHY